MSRDEPATPAHETPLGQTRHHAITDAAAAGLPRRTDASMGAAKHRRRPDPIDRLGDAYQQARLLRRRRQREVALAVVGGGFPGVRAAMTRYRAAVAWEHRCGGRFLRAVLTAYLYRPDSAAWADRPHGRPASPDAATHETNEQEAEAWT